MRIKISPAFFITVAALFVIGDAFSVAAILFSSAIHEAGHLLAMRVLGAKVEALELGLFGGTIRVGKRLISYRKEAVVALSGAFFNLIAAAIAFLVLRGGFSPRVFFFFLANITLAVFNLLPVSSLDGGVALRALLLTKKELYDAERISSVLSGITLVLLFSLGVRLVFFSHFNLSLIIIAVTLFLESREGHIISGYEFCRRTS